MLPIKLGRDAANALRAKTGAGAARGGHVKRYAGDGDVSLSLIRIKAQRGPAKTKGIGHEGGVFLVAERLELSHLDLILLEVGVAVEAGLEIVNQAALRGLVDVALAYLAGKFI